MIESLEDAARYLESLINLEQRPELSFERMSLAPMRALLERLDHPERDLSILHIAGSKGKGSTALFAEGILRALGARVGVFTSPHLVRWTERFRVDGVEVAGGELAAVVELLRPHVEALRAGDPRTAPTFFDATTAAALLLFARAGVDHAILEVGLGGRLDSTNAVTPAVTCITSIELEHTDKLGHTHAEIAAEKAGILEKGVACVMGRLPSEARDVVRARAAELEAPLVELGVDFEDVDPSALGVLGHHQCGNAALAREAVRRLVDVEVRDFEGAVARGLQQTTLPGRIELLRERPRVIIDGAHTGASARELARVLSTDPARTRHLLLSVSGGKDLAAILDALLPEAARVTVTRADPHRSLPAVELADAIRSRGFGGEVEIVEDPRAAAQQAFDALAPEGLLCATGSVYLAGIARDVLSREA